MFASATFGRFFNAVSIGYHQWFDVGDALPDHRRGWMPRIVEELVLFNNRRDLMPRALELLRLDDKLVCREHLAAAPLHDGFIAALELVRDDAGGDVRPQVDAFLERERQRDAGIEQHLRDVYATWPGSVRNDPIFDFMDYPVFDNGSAGVGFGVMVENRGPRWLWSRVYFAHK